METDKDIGWESKRKKIQNWQRNQRKTQGTKTVTKTVLRERTYVSDTPFKFDDKTQGKDRDKDSIKTERTYVSDTSFKFDDKTRGSSWINVISTSNRIRKRSKTEAPKIFHLPFFIPLVP